MPKSMRQSFEQDARETNEAPAPPSGEAWSGTVVAILAGPQLEIAGYDGKRTIDCGRVVVYIGESERNCVDANAGDVVVVKYPENPTGTIKVTVVARRSQ